MGTKKHGFGWRLSFVLILLGMGTGLSWPLSAENQAYYQALGLYHQKKWDEAKNAFQAYAREFPQSKWQPAVQLRLADMADTPAMSIDGYLAILNKDPRSEWGQDALWGLISTYFTLGQYAKVITYVGQLTPQYPSRLSKALTLAGEAHLALNEPEQAEQAFAQAFEKSPEPLVKQKALAGMADAEAGLKAYNQALSHYDQYLKDYPQGSLTSHVLNQKSHLLALQGKKAQAMKTARQLAAAYPESEEGAKAQNQLKPASDREAFTVQVGAFSKNKYAMHLENKLRTKGYNAYHLKVNLKGQMLIQVRVGQYSSEAFAEKIGEKLKQQEDLPFVVLPYEKPQADR